MSEFDKLSKEITKELKKLSKVQEGPNAAAYLLFLKKTHEKAQTFDSENPDTYINYVTGEKPQSTKKSKILKSVASADGGGGGGGGGALEKKKIKKAVKPVPK
jgi:hypothetical protein